MKRLHSRLVSGSVLLSVPIAALVLTLGRAQATTYYVDGACPSSGTGTSLSCGASGPFTTISIGISAMHPGDTLDIRGAHAAHGACPGSDGVYNEYIGVWGTTSDGFPGQALNCTAQSPCAVEGCSSANCGTDETPIVRGMVRRTDWTSQGNGVWFRTMMQDNTEYIGADTPRDDYDPEMVLQGASEPFTPLQYAGDNVATPPVGAWSYNTSNHSIFINPTGGGNPNTDTVIWVPNRRGLLVIEGDSGTGGCPSGAGNCPRTNYATFRRLMFEGSRWMGILAWPGDSTAHGTNLTFDAVTIRYIPRFFLNSYRADNFTITNTTAEYGCRGISFVPPGTGGCFGFRLSHSVGGTFTNVTSRFLGTAGKDAIAGDGRGIECQWCSAPWNNKTTNAISANGFGFDLKQAVNATVTNHTATDLSFLAFQFDVSHDSELAFFKYVGTRGGVLIRQYTPNAPNFTRNYNITIRNGRIDESGFNAALTAGIFSSPMGDCCTDATGTACSGVGFSGCSSNTACTNPAYPTCVQVAAGQFGAKIYNNLITRPSYAGIAIDTTSGINIWNNSIFGTKTSIDVPPDGIKLLNTNTNTAIENNIVNVTGGDALEVHANSIAGNIFDFDDLYNSAFDCSGNNTPGAVRWGVTGYDGNSYISTGGTCYASLVAFQAANPAVETHAISGNPLFVNTSAAPPDLRLQSGSAAINRGVTLTGFVMDFYNYPRPFGSAWDIGAVEYVAGTPVPVPTLIQAVQTPGP